MQTPVRKILVRQQAHYKSQLGKKSSSLPGFKVSKRLSVDRPPLTTLVPDRQNPGKLIKKLPHTTKSFKMLEVRDRAMSIEQTETPNSVLLERKSLVSFQHHECLLNGEKPINQTSNLPSNQKREFLINRIPGYRQTATERKYYVHCYDYRPRHGTVKLHPIYSTISFHARTAVKKSQSFSIARNIDVLCKSTTYLYRNHS